MGTLRRFTLSDPFSLVNMGSVHGFLYQKMVLFAASFWVSVFTLFCTLLGLFHKIIFRVQGGNGDSQTRNSSILDGSNRIEPEAEREEPKAYIVENQDMKGSDDLEEKESPEFFFKFEFPSYKELGNGATVCLDSVPSTSSNKYEFLSGKDFSGYMVEPENVNFTVKELYADSNNGSFPTKEIIDKGLLSEGFSRQENSEKEALGYDDEEITEKLEGTTVTDASCDVKFISEKDLFGFDSDSDSTTSSHEFMNHFMYSTSDGFLSDRDFEKADSLQVDDGEKEELAEQDLNSEDSENPGAGHEAGDFDEEDRDVMDELEKLDEIHIQNSGIRDSEILSGSNNSKQDELGGKDKELMDNSSDNSTKSNLQSSTTDSDDSNGLETLWEHQELIEQLKMELKKVRAIGLPTILEESESPKITEDLKPWKIDEKFQHEDRMSELHKFYKSYRERMRKFDILNYQKMYAIGFLQSKDPLQSVSSCKSSSAQSSFTSIFLQNLPLCKRKKSDFDPMVNFIKELHGDLEMVYVGQLCLSWEILHWQYEKALELWDSDHYSLRRFNEVAGEFQQFQVLMQRFIENEPFEGPRVQNYVKNRCILRNLLQVPVIREDNIKDKRKARRKGSDENAITGDMLVEIMEESIRIFWRFVRADKDANHLIQKGRKGTQVEPQDPAELELFTEVRASLQKKERKLKDILRSGNCILRRFQKQQQEDSSDQVLYFFSQVDMKLVSRVLKMSKITTDQLLWCRSKLSKINFVSRKIHVEPSFLLFPC